ncbi:hypothetical protein [Caballeronia sp. RCC_10]|uniref:hypothetical protein n=1 Tax=Caballeronia sp. RCC_10 TaxID=3239227 RepID=UPI0035234443
MLALILTPLADFLTTWASVGGGSEAGARYSLLVRGCLLAGMVSIMLVAGNVKRATCIRALLATIAVGAAAIMCLAGEMSGQEFAEQAIFISKTFCFFVYTAALSTLSHQQRSKLEPLVLGALLVYAAAIIVGAIFSVDMFRSYQASNHIRSGYKGIVYAQNETSALMIAGLGYANLRVLRFGWKKLNILAFLMLSVACLLIGTKAAMVGAFAIICIYFYARHSVIVATFRASNAVLVLLLIAIVAYAAVPSVRDAVSLSRDYFVYHYDRASGNALLTILLSGRDIKFAQVWADLANTSYLAVLTGGYPVTRYLIEIDVPDLVICLGAPLFCYYFWSLRREFVFAGSAPLARYGRLLFLVVLAVACTAGHTLNSAVTSPYLAFIAVVIRFECDKRSAQRLSTDA